MNANFVNIATNVSNMAQNAISVSDAGGSAGQMGSHRAFEDRFQSEINRLGSSETLETGAVSAIRIKAEAQRIASKVSGTTETIENTVGAEFVDKLKQSLLEIAGGDLENLTMDAQGLDSLEKLLLKAGFDADQVSEVIGELEETSETEALTMDEVFAALSDLGGDLEVEVDEKADTEVAYLETSALPFVKRMLSDMGVSSEDIASVMDEADGGGQGLKLDSLIGSLESLSSSAKTPLSVEDTDDSFKMTMARLNLPVQTDSQEMVTMDDLIQAFEDYKVQQEAVLSTGESTTDAVSLLAAQADAESVESLVTSLFQSISLASEIESSSFSYRQVKDQFVNDLMIPGQDGAEQKSLFAVQDPQMDKAVKELTSLFVGNDKAGTQLLEQEQSMTALGKEVKTELTKTESVVQTNTTTVNDLEAFANDSKARSTPRTLPAYVTNQVGRGIVRAVNQGDTSLTLQVKPPELGRLTLTIDHQSTGIKVNIVTENQAARDILASNVNELKAALGNAGISLDSFEVDMSSDFKQSMANTGNQSGQSGGKNGNRQGNEFKGSGEEAIDDIAVSAEDLVSDSSYHFVA